MYEDISYELILQRMIDRVLAENPNIDTREGSIIYNALAPAAMEIMMMYIQLGAILDESFADTQTREYLIKRCAERGIYPEKATKAILKGELNMDIPIGARFSLDDLNYRVIENISSGIFNLECESFGIEGNKKLGTLIPIEYIEGLELARLTELLIPGEDEEDTESLRKRYFNSLDSQSFGGNIADYKEKTNAINGVGGVKVYPTPDGVGGTVKLVVIDSTFGVPSPTLLSAVQSEIDPAQNRGVGIGLAPIGHVVTVEGVGASLVNIATNITYQDGWKWADIEPSVKVVIDDYFSELSKTWENESNLIVRISQIEIRLLNIAGVLDIADTTLNGESQNLVLGEDFIPVRGEVSG